MFCPICGTERSQNANFCHNCGYDLRNLNAAASQPTKVTKTFELERPVQVWVDKMLATVKVEEYYGTTVQISITGLEAEVSQFETELSDDATLYLRCEIPVITWQKSPWKQDGIYSVNGTTYYYGCAVDVEKMLDVKVKIPAGTSLRLSNLVGKANIGDLSSSMVLRIENEAVIQAGKSPNVTLRRQGSGSAHVEAGGKVKVTGSGSADFSIDFAREVSVDCSGSGTTTFKLVTGDLNVDISGSGDVEIEEANTEETTLRTSASGSIRVRSGHAKSLTATTDASGNVKHEGVADTARLKTTASGNVLLNRCITEPGIIKTASGKARVNQVG